ncbi:hypothetical protein [Rickettsia endosymbiont of Halotydeus destructor]
MHTDISEQAIEQEVARRIENIKNIVNDQNPVSTKVTTEIGRINPTVEA